MANVIQIDSISALLGVLTVVVAGGIAWGTLKSSVSHINKVLLDEIKPDMKDVRERFAVVEDRVGSLWKDKYAPASSPRMLNDRGATILAKSGIKEVVDNNIGNLLEAVRKRNPTNAYDAEQAVMEVMTRDFPANIDLSSLKDGAFRVGANIDVVLFVGGIYLRDLIFPGLGFSLDDIDRPTPRS